MDRMRDGRKSDIMSIAKKNNKAQFSIPWTPVNRYVQLIMARSELRHWGFTQDDADKLEHALKDHRGVSKLTAVNIWLGYRLDHNWHEAMLWLTDEINKLGCDVQTYFGKGKLSFLPGSERRGSRELSVFDLDLSDFREVGESISPRELRSVRESWPGLEIAWFLALNPQVFVAMDGKKIPCIFAPGLTHNSVGMPHFSCNNREARIVVSGKSFKYPSTVLAAFSK